MIPSPLLAAASLAVADGPVPEWVYALPHMNGAINATCSCLLVMGLALVKAKRIGAHRACMMTALTLSVIFLASYGILHVHIGATPFRGEGAVRTLYYTILITHMTLAASVPVLAVMTVRLAVRGEFDRHKRLARWTFPIWLYVSVTGVIVYLFLYHWFPAPVMATAANGG